MVSWGFRKHEQVIRKKKRVYETHERLYHGLLLIACCTTVYILKNFIQPSSLFLANQIITNFTPVFSFLSFFVVAYITTASLEQTKTLAS